MLFNSIDFLIFLPIVFLLYWFVFRTIKQKNLLIVIVSYIFYGWWIIVSYSLSHSRPLVAT